MDDGSGGQQTTFKRGSFLSGNHQEIIELTKVSKGKRNWMTSYE